MTSSAVERPRRLAIKFSPPTLLIEFETDTGFKHARLRVRDPTQDAALVTSRLFAGRHRRLLAHVKRAQVQRLVATMLNKKDPLITSDLNKCSAFQLDRAKKLMDVDFERHRVDKADARFVYDKSLDFDAAVEDSGWDEGFDV